MIKLRILLIIIVLSSCKNKETREVQTTYVRSGTFTEELTEEGTLKAVNSITIAAPMLSYRFGSLKITNIVSDGSEVQKGDTLIVFDLSEIKKAIIENEQRLVIGEAELEKLKATQESAISDLEADLEISKISREISRINFEQSAYESDITRKEIGLRLENADIALKRAQEQIDNRKKINQEELSQKEISIRQLQSILTDAENAVSSLYVVSPAHGIAILEQNWMTRLKYQAGEQPYSGTKLIELPDLSAMMAEIKVNEVDVSKVLPGMDVTIITDAYSDLRYEGKVVSIANLAQNKDSNSKIKVFPVVISIQGTSDKLMPGLSASCKIKVREVPDVLYIPIDALFRDQGLEFVYVKTNTGYRRQDVKTGMSNTDYVVITEGLKGDEELALMNPFIEKKNGSGKTAAISPKQ